MKLFRRFQVLYAEIKARCYSNVQWNRGVEKKLIPWATVNSAENTGHRSADSISAKVYGINEKRTPYNSIIKKNVKYLQYKTFPRKFPCGGIFYTLVFWFGSIFRIEFCLFYESYFICLIGEQYFLSPLSHLFPLDFLWYASLLCLLLKATPRNYPMLRSLINFTPKAWDFLPQQRRLPQKSPFTPPKFLSIPARQIPLYCLYFLRGTRLFCRFIFPYKTISVSAIFLWMKKAHRAKIVRIAKVFPCEVFFAKQNRLP